MSSKMLQRINIAPFYVGDKQTAWLRWEEWVEQFNHVLDELDIVDKQQQKDLLFVNAGSELRELHEKVAETSKDQEDDVEAVVKSITIYFTDQYNQDYAIYKFRQCKQQPQENISDYVAKLEFLAKCCKFDQFTDQNAEIKAQILDRGYSDIVREKAFHEVVTLDQLIEFAKTVPVDSVKKETSRGEEGRGTKEPSGGQERQATKEQSGGQERRGTKEPSGGQERWRTREPSGGQERWGTNSQGDWRASKNQRGYRASKNQRGGYASKHEQTVERGQQHQTYKGTESASNVAGTESASNEMHHFNSRLPGKSITSRRLQQCYDYFLVLDFEATCDHPKGPDPQEIIEFPVLKVSATTFEVESKFHQFVKPVHHPQLTNFCMKLTTITQDEVDNGMPFPYVLKDFGNWIENDVGMQSRFLFVTCGDWDLKHMLPNQCYTSEVEVPRYCEEWLNIKKAFGWVTDSYPKGMIEMIDQLNLKHTGVHHRGLDDCKNIANIVRALADKGCQFEPTFTNGKQRY